MYTVKYINNRGDYVTVQSDDYMDAIVEFCHVAMELKFPVYIANDGKMIKQAHMDKKKEFQMLKREVIS